MHKNYINTERVMRMCIYIKYGTRIRNVAWLHKLVPLYMDNYNMAVCKWPLLCKAEIAEHKNVSCTSTLHVKASFTLSRCTPRCVPAVFSHRTGTNRDGIRVRSYIPGSATDQARFGAQIDHGMSR